MFLILDFKKQPYRLILFLFLLVVFLGLFSLTSKRVIAGCPCTQSVSHVCGTCPCAGGNSCAATCQECCCCNGCYCNCDNNQCNTKSGWDSQCPGNYCCGGKPKNGDETCGDPGQPLLFFTNIGAASARVNWQAVDWGDETGNSCSVPPNNGLGCGKGKRGYVGKLCVGNYCDDGGSLVASLSCTTNLSWDLSGLNPGTTYYVYVWSVNKCTCDKRIKGSFTTEASGYLLGKVINTNLPTEPDPAGETWTGASCSACPPDKPTPWCRQQGGLTVTCQQFNGERQTAASWFCNDGNVHWRTESIYPVGKNVRCTLSNLPDGYICSDPAWGTTECTVDYSDADGNPKPVVPGANHLWFGIVPGEPSLPQAQILGRVYEDSFLGPFFWPGSCGAYSNCQPIPGMSVACQVAGLGSVPLNWENLPPVGFKASKTYDAGPLATCSLTLPPSSGYQCQTGSCQTSKPLVEGPNYLDFNLVSVEPPTGTDWFQTKDGDVYSGDSILVNLPLGEVFSEEGSGGFPGVVVYRSSADFKAGHPSTGGPDHWLVNTSMKREKFGYFKELLKPQIRYPLGGVYIPESGVYLAEPEDPPTRPAISISAKGTLPAGQKTILLVEGDVHITIPIVVPSGAFFMLVASGDIYLPEDQLEGVFMADGKIITPETADQLQYEGIFVADKFELKSQFSSDSAPAEKFVYRPDLLINAPESLGVGGHLWEELAP